MTSARIVVFFFLVAVTAFAAWVEPQLLWWAGAGVLSSVLFLLGRIVRKRKPNQARSPGTAAKVGALGLVAASIGLGLVAAFVIQRRLGWSAAAAAFVLTAEYSGEAEFHSRKNRWALAHAVFLKPQSSQPPAREQALKDAETTLANSGYTLSGVHEKKGKCFERTSGFRHRQDSWAAKTSINFRGPLLSRVDFTGSTLVLVVPRHYFYDSYPTPAKQEFMLDAADNERIEIPLRSKATARVRIRHPILRNGLGDTIVTGISSWFGNIISALLGAVLGEFVRKFFEK